MRQDKHRYIGCLLGLLLLLMFHPPVIKAEVTEAALGYNTLAETTASPDQLITVKDFKVYDGDTADFILNRATEPSIKARFLLMDAPEIRGGVPYSKAARKRVNQIFEEAELIQIEYEGPKKDKYQRDLVHVWVDGHLLSEILIREGYAIARYIHQYLPNSQYVKAIYEAQEKAKYEGLRVWVDGDLEFINKAEYELQANHSAGSVNEAEEVYYRNCKEVWQAGKAPIREGDPGFRPQFDGDKDGVGCEVPQ
ncbi:thermonuclease family protein [Globicatella sp. PHS-GS-PNBC-21-1553]|uniref:thermonuclease family protein n=1 Tax=Globicatella sp. PHS-GS-PNBC-21-1553 TaxID=2885764 RepID=UPI00298F3BCE|nr:thermonuclease family protein [Globicatella sp. PHS-GS-PNBC-21-1553]WPC07807.1 thermonuclease family protein [Globicatella sp. PHS-GS-PNBC-21-1553]